MDYSKEYIGIITLFLTPIAGNYLSDACAGEVSGIVASTAVAGIAALFLLVKRYKRGGVTPLGVKK